MSFQNSPSFSFPSSDSSDYSPSTSPPTKKTKVADGETPSKSSATPKIPKTAKTPKTARPGSKAQNNGIWTAGKKAEFMDDVIAAGYKALDLEATATKVNSRLPFQTQVSQTGPRLMTRSLARVEQATIGGPARAQKEQPQTEGCQGSARRVI